MLAWPTRTLPFLLTLTRSLVPLWVLSLGIVFFSFFLVCLVGDGTFAAATSDETELSASQLWRLIYYYCITEVLNYPLGDLETDFFVSLLATTVDQGNLNFVARFQKFGYLAHLDAEVMSADLEAETHLLQIECLGGLAVLLLLLGPLVVKLAPVDNLTYRRTSVGGDFYQVKSLVLSNLQGFLTAQDTELFAIGIDDAQLGGPNLFIQAGVFGYGLSPLIIIGLNVLSILTDGASEVKQRRLQIGPSSCINVLMAINVEGASGTESLPPRDWRDALLAHWAAEGFMIGEVLLRPERTSVGWAGPVGGSWDYVRMPGPWASPEDEQADRHYRETVQRYEDEFGDSHVRTASPTARMLHDHPDYTAGLHRVILFRTAGLL
jgi:hypothetical protein